MRKEKVRICRVNHMCEYCGEKLDIGERYIDGRVVLGKKDSFGRDFGQYTYRYITHADFKKCNEFA